MKITLACALFLMVQVAVAQDCFLVVGSGGGVTGSATVYKIGMDGTVWKGVGVGQLTYGEQSKLKKSVARKYYKKARTLATTSPDFNYPGNMYYSIATLENKKESKITWGDGQHPAPEQARNLYQEITAILTTLTFTPNATK